MQQDRPMTRWERFKDNDIVWSFVHSPGAMVAAAITLIAILACVFAPLIAPFDPFDPSQISLWDGKLPPSWVEGGQPQYLLGTDNQGRDKRYGNKRPALPMDRDHGFGDGIDYRHQVLPNSG